MNSSSVPLSTPAIKYGKEHEAIARLLYQENYKKRAHKKPILLKVDYMCPSNIHTWVPRQMDLCNANAAGMDF